MVTATQTLNFVFSEKHMNYMRGCRKCQINVAEGAVRAGKTVDNVFAFSYELETTPDRIHLASGSTMANAKLNIGDCNGFGLEGQFRGRCHWGKYKDNEALYVNTVAGQKIVIFAGAALANSFKKIRGNSYGMWIATEINLHHSSFIEEAFNRQLAAKHIKVFWDLNPSHPKHEIYTRYIDRYAGKQAKGEFPPGYNYQHFTIFDNATLPPGRIEEIISRYESGSIWYIRDIEGKRTIAEGLIYRSIATAVAQCENRFRIAKAKVQELARQDRLMQIVIGIDFGGNGSGHAFVATAITEGYESLIALRSERYLEGSIDPLTGHTLQDIDPEVLSELFLRFYRQIIADYGYVTRVYADNAETVLIKGLRTAMNDAEYGDIGVNLAWKRRINDRIFATTSLAAQGRLWITEDCATLEEALSMAVWDQKNIELKRLDDGTSDIDSLDAFEYTFERDIERLNRQ